MPLTNRPLAFKITFKQYKRSHAGAVSAGVVSGMHIVAVVSTIFTLLLAGCEREIVTPRPEGPAAIYSGPAFLRGTVGSLTRLRGAQPQLVSGYGLVVNLQGTGSSDVPAFLRMWMVNEMRKKGVGSSRYGHEGVSPEAMLASQDTAVVLVQGLIPTGAVKGTRFDVQVSALPQTQTTDLQHGRLWTADLAAGGSDPSLLYRHKSGKASGLLFVNSDPTSSDEQLGILRRRAVVLSGGVATANRKLELILNQSSWQRSRAIADRINERFPKGPEDHFDTAVPVTDVLIRLNIPRRFGQQPDELLASMSHLYLQRSSDFEPQQAQRLADRAVVDPTAIADIVLAWHAMGKTTLPVLRNYYDHQQIEVMIAALEAGARLQDEVASDALARVAELDNPVHRRRAAEILAYLPDSIRGSRILQQLLDDPDRDVRVQAYESLARIGDPVIQRVPIADREGIKFVLDVVPSERGLVYITQLRIPRLVVFNPDTGFKTPFLSRMWENQLMLRVDDPRDPLTVFYQGGAGHAGQSFEIPPRLVDLVALMARRSSVMTPDDGLNMSYSQVTAVLEQLKHKNHIVADLHIQPSPLAAAVQKAEELANTEPRPETGGGSEP